MTPTITKPFNQKIRIAALRVMAIGLIPMALMVHPMLADSITGEVLEVTGIGLIIAGIIGRFWSILYIGGHKNALVMDQGPYSMCRHPLYFFSAIAVLGFGLMMQSVVFAVLLTSTVFVILSLTAAREEAYLHDRFGPEYARYSAATPRILPNPALFRTRVEIPVNTNSLRTNFFDAVVFVALIPVAESVAEIREAWAIPSLWLY